MSEYHVLCFKPTPRLEWRGDDSQDEADQFQHGALTLGDSFNEVFGTHNHIEIIPGKKRGQCEIVVVGALAQYLAFAQQKTTADSCGDDGTFLMVAGACNPRELTLPPIPV
jgi:hypothetical protein